MLASFEEAEDAVQETFLRAWRGRESFGGPGQYRAWLYRIATNVCLDMLRSRHGVPRQASFAEVPWLQPYPESLLDQVESPEETPEDTAIRRETISLAFLAALQALPPRQRAALIARDVLGWPTSETATALGTSVAAANSALQRARATMGQHLPRRRSDWSAPAPTAQETALVARFIDAHERCDTQAAMAIVAQDLRITTPQPVCFDGVQSIAPLMAEAAAMGSWRLLPVRANRMPAAASYLRRPGDTAYLAFKLDVLRIESGLLAEVTTFDAKLFPAFGLRSVLAAVP
jgi:RNA polymerase sigma-70 factor (TIGR02960 family)